MHAAFVGPKGVGKETAKELYFGLLREFGIKSNTDLTLEDLIKADERKVNGQIGLSSSEAIVLLGTAEELQTFCTAHPRHAEKFKHRVTFSELGGDVLAKIMEKMAVVEGFALTAEAQEKMRRVLKGKRGGSGVAKELLERAIRHHAQRLAPEVGHPDFDSSRLNLLDAADFAGDYAAMQTNALKQLETMTGLSEVKESLRRIVAMLRQNKEREVLGLDVTKPSLHALFVGNPGTGKTSVARIYAQALKEVGFLTKGHHVGTTASELIGDVIGATEKKTLTKLNDALGGVLFIDEAHNLVAGGTGINGRTGSGDFGTAALRTILAFMEDHRDDLVVIFAGYPDHIEKLLDADPGLRRRFTEKIRFADYSPNELGDILDGMVAAKGYLMDEHARKSALELLDRRRVGKDFGNAGAVRNLFEAALLRQSERLEAIRKAGNGLAKEDYQRLISDDFEGKAVPDPNAALKELDGFVGLAAVKKQFRKVMAMVNFAKARGGDPKESFEPYFLFSGPPGTGKTSVAQVLGRVFKGMGLLPDEKVVQVNALDLIAGFTGQTSGKTKETVEKALGGVLFIDEIGGLAKTAGGFSKDAVNQLLTLLETYRGRLAVVVAGYDHDVNAFLRLDDGLSRRFANRLTFEALTTDEAVTLFDMRLREKKPSLTLSDEAKTALTALIGKLRDAPSWASGGDVRTLVTEVIGQQAVYWAENPDIDSHGQARGNLPNEHSESEGGTQQALPVGGNATTEIGDPAKLGERGSTRRRELEGTRASVIDINSIPPEVLRKAVNTLMDKKSRDAGFAGVHAADDHAAHPHAAATAETTAPVSDVGGKTRSAANTRFAARVEEAALQLNLPAKKAARQLASGDPRSALARAVAEKTGETPEETAAKLAKLAQENAAKPKESGWVCMYCHNSNPACSYKGRPDREQFNAFQ